MRSLLGNCTTWTLFFFLTGYLQLFHIFRCELSIDLLTGICKQRCRRVDDSRELNGLNVLGRYGAQLGEWRRRRRGETFLAAVRPPALPRVASHAGERAAAAQRAAQRRRQEHLCQRALGLVGVPVRTTPVLASNLLISNPLL